MPYLPFFIMLAMALCAGIFATALLRSFNTPPARSTLSGRDYLLFTLITLASFSLLLDVL